jgi:hypothetical protein
MLAITYSSTWEIKYCGVWMHKSTLSLMGIIIVDNCNDFTLRYELYSIKDYLMYYRSFKKESNTLSFIYKNIKRDVILVQFSKAKKGIRGSELEILEN